MASNNTVIFIGNLAADPEEIKTDSRTFYSFTMATSERYKDDNDVWNDTAPDFHELLAFDSLLISSLKGLRKGARIKVEGKVNYRDVPMVWKGKETTKKEASFIARSINLAPLPAKTSNQVEE